MILQPAFGHMVRFCELSSLNFVEFQRRLIIVQVDPFFQLGSALKYRQTL